MAKKDKKRKKKDRKRRAAVLQPYNPNTLSQTQLLQSLIGRMGSGYGGGHISNNISFGGYGGGPGGFGAGDILGELGRLGGLVNTLVEDSKKGRVNVEQTPPTANFVPEPPPIAMTNPSPSPIPMSSPAPQFPSSIYGNLALTGPLTPQQVLQSVQGGFTRMEYDGDETTEVQNQLVQVSTGREYTPPERSMVIRPNNFRPPPPSRMRQPRFMIENPSAPPQTSDSLVVMEKEEEPLGKRKREEPERPPPPLFPASTQDLSVFVEDVDPEQMEDDEEFVFTAASEPLQTQQEMPTMTEEEPAVDEGPNLSGKDEGPVDVDELLREKKTIQEQLEVLEKALTSNKERLQQVVAEKAELDKKQKEFNVKIKAIGIDKSLTNDERRRQIYELRRQMVGESAQDSEDRRNLKTSLETLIVQIEEEIKVKQSQLDKEQAELSGGQKAGQVSRLRERLSRIDELLAIGNGPIDTPTTAAPEPTPEPNRKETAAERLARKQAARAESLNETPIIIVPQPEVPRVPESSVLSIENGVVEMGEEVVEPPPSGMLAIEGIPSENALVVASETSMVVHEGGRKKRFMLRSPPPSEQPARKKAMVEDDEETIPTSSPRQMMVPEISRAAMRLFPQRESRTAPLAIEGNQSNAAGSSLLPFQDSGSSSYSFLGTELDQIRLNAVKSLVGKGKGGKNRKKGNTSDA